MVLRAKNVRGSVWEMGVDSIDEDHGHILALCAQVQEAVAGKAAEEEVFDLLVRLVSLHDDHFAAEEAILAKAGFPGLAAHRADHRRLSAAGRARLRHLEGTDDALQRTAAAAREMVGEILAHLIHFDMRYKWFLHENGGSDYDVRESLLRDITTGGNPARTG